uniref:WRKY transcription factor 44 n=1 Tax=Erigeron canadensis TaxID=72917 RepID=UPI001CB9A7BD|nr:WRKY transcription factor 44 [Erigeron canadensis]
MDVEEEAELIRPVISKPVASRPTVSNFRSFSAEIVPDVAVNVSAYSSVNAIRPKTVRFKQPLKISSPPPVEMFVDSSQADELGATQASHLLADKILKSTNTSSLLYKPLAKTVSRTTVSLLANMGTINARNEQAPAQDLPSQSEMVRAIDPPKVIAAKSGNDKRLQLYTNNSDRPSYDGYNWRKYGQKQVKGSEYPRSYYKCTHSNCLVKKKVERTLDGEIAEIVYKGEHNHLKPRLPRRHAFDGTSQDSNPQLPNIQPNDDNVIGSSSHLNNFIKLKESCNHVSSEAFDAGISNLDSFCGDARAQDGMTAIRETADDVPSSKRRKSLSRLNETCGEGLQEPRVVVHDGTDSEAISDGFHWRKYGQKVVKGNPYPRSYYRCTGVKCNVRKHVERASDDPGVFITTYEGKHNHEMPIKKAN